MTKMDYLLINVYIGNREQCQLETLQNLSILLENYDNFYDKNMILAGHFNLFFNKKLNCKRGKTTTEKQSVSHYPTIFHVISNFILPEKPKRSYKKTFSNLPLLNSSHSEWIS